MNPLKQLAGQTAIYGLSSVLARVLNFLLVPFYTRIFVDPAEYGIVNELYAYVAFFIIILSYGMETAYFRFSSKYRNSQMVFSTALISLITTSCIFAAFIFLFYSQIAGLIGYGESEKFILFLGLVLSMDAIAAIPFARLRYTNRALLFALIKLFNVGVNIFFNVFFLVLLPWLYTSGKGDFITGPLYNPDLRVGYVFLSNMLASFFTLMFFIKDILKTRMVYSLKLFREMILYSLPLLIAGLAGTVNEVIDRIMLRFRLPDNIDALEQIGIYGANIKIAVLMTLFIQMFRYAFEPFFFSHEEDSDNRRLYARVLNYFVIFGVFVFLVITMYIDVFQHIVGREYREGLNVVPIVLLGNLFLGIYFNLSVWYKLKGVTLFGALFASCGALVTLTINYYFIPVYGYMASAWGHFFAYAVMVILAYAIGRKYYAVPYDVKRILGYIAFGCLLFLAGYVFRVEDNLARYTINTFIIVIFTGTVLIKEKQLMNDVFGWKRHRNE